MKGKPTPPEVIARMVQYRREGMKLVEIVERTGVSRSTVQNHCGVMEQGTKKNPEKRELKTAASIRAERIVDALDTIIANLLESRIKEGWSAEIEGIERIQRGNWNIPLPILQKSVKRILQIGGNTEGNSTDVEKIKAYIEAKKAKTSSTQNQYGVQIPMQQKPLRLSSTQVLAIQCALDNLIEQLLNMIVSRGSHPVRDIPDEGKITLLVNRLGLDRRVVEESIARINTAKTDDIPDQTDSVEGVPPR